MAEQTFQLQFKKKCRRSFTVLQDAKGGLLKRIWEEKIMVNEDNVIDLNKEGAMNTVMSRIRNEKIVSIWLTTFWNHYLVNGDITISKESFNPGPCAFPVNKGFPYKKRFNEK